MAPVSSVPASTTTSWPLIGRKRQTFWVWSKLAVYWPPGTNIGMQNRRVVEVTVQHRFGVMPEQPHTVHVERLNGVLRDWLNCLTRKTHGFAKRDQTWWALVSLCLFEHNWLKEHVALRQEAAGLPNGRCYLRRSPAMA